jgi:hypothetical protein
MMNRSSTLAEVTLTGNYQKRVFVQTAEYSAGVSSIVIIKAHIPYLCKIYSPSNGLVFLNYILWLAIDNWMPQLIHSRDRGRHIVDIQP